MKNIIGDGYMDKEFFARLWILDGDFLSDLEVWCYELEKMDLKSRSSSQWVSEHLSELDMESFLSDLNLDLSKNWQVLIKGKIHGKWIDDYEWDEEINVDKHESIEISEEYLKIMEME